MSIEDLLLKHEGLRLKPYTDTVGKLTIGVGRNLDDMGLTKAECLFLLANDIDRCRSELQVEYPWFDSLTPVRQDALINMAFNLGRSRLRGFKRFLEACWQHRWSDASRHMLDSTWARQVGRRAIELAHMIETGEYPADVD